MVFCNSDEVIGRDRYAVAAEEKKTMGATGERKASRAGESGGWDGVPHRQK
jgi:hypothetical protein